MDREAMAETKIIRKSDLGRFETCGREGRVEDHPSESASSALSNKSVELSLWANADSISDLHALGRDWTGAGIISLFLFGNLRTIGVESRTREDTSSGDRVLDLVRRFRQRGSDSHIIGTNRLTHTSRSGKESARRSPEPSRRVAERSRTTIAICTY